MPAASGDLCPGTCNATWRVTGEGEPYPGDPIWCAMDTTRIRRRLAELDDLAALYAMNGHTQAAEASPDGHVIAHTPSPSPSADDLDELERMLLAWEDAYRDTRGWPSPPRRGSLASVITTTVAWLTAHLSGADGILASSLAVDFGTEVSQWHREFMAKTRAGSGRHRKPAACPRCGLRLLSWAEGDDHVICGGCNRHMSMDEYHGELAAQAQQLEQAG